MSDEKKPRVQINYKSGISMVVECAEFSVTQKVSGALSVSWVAASPNPLLLGVSEIESVWELP